MIAPVQNDLEELPKKFKRISLWANNSKGKDKWNEKVIQNIKIFDLLKEAQTEMILEMKTSINQLKPSVENHGHRTDYVKNRLG